MEKFPSWKISPNISDYSETISEMEKRVDAIYHGVANELFWLLEHSPLYTAGTSARPDELLDSKSLPVFQTGRGGRYTYHGPGQRIIYVMLDLTQRGRDLRRFVAALETWVIHSLQDFGIEGRIIPGKVGVWVATDEGMAKIAAIGIRVRHWVSYHGIAVNIDPDLKNYVGIQPCGLDAPITSLRKLGHATTMTDFDEALRFHATTMLESLSSKST